MIKNTHIFLLTSYDEVHHFLYEIQILDKKDIPYSIEIFVLFNDDLYEFISEIFKFKKPTAKVHKLKIYNRIQLRNSLKSIVDNLTDSYNEKKYYNRVYIDNFKKFSNASIYYFTRYMNAPVQFFIYKMSNNNKVILFESLKFEHTDSFKNWNIINIIKAFKQKFIFGKFATYVSTPHKLMTYNSDKFINNFVDNHFTYSNQKNRLKNFDIEKWKPKDLEEIQYIFYDQPLIGTRVSEEEYNRFIIEFQNIFGNLKLDKKIAYKLHPNNKKNAKIYKGCDILHSKHPSIFFDGGISFHLSICSNSILSKKVGINISLIRLIRFLDKKAQKYIEDRIIRSEYDVLIPNNFLELEKIIKKSLNAK